MLLICKTMNSKKSCFEQLFVQLTIKPKIDDGLRITK